MVELDARETTEITVDVEQDGLEPSQQRMEYSISAGTGLVGAYRLPTTVDHLFAAPMSDITDGDFEYLTRWRLRTPFISVAENGNPLDVTGLYGSAMPTEELTLDAVYAGTGTPTELAAVETDGNAVVITRDRSLDLTQIAAGVEAASAALLVVVNDEPGEFSDGVSWGEPPVLPGRWGQRHRGRGSDLPDRGRPGAAHHGWRRGQPGRLRPGGPAQRWHPDRPGLRPGQRGAGADRRQLPRQPGARRRRVPLRLPTPHGLRRRDT